MLTPQEVQDKRFEKAVFGGYDMAAVDDFLERVTEDYASLYKENAVLKSKLKVLVDTVEEYRSVDESMRRALYSAQKMANDLVVEAQSQADALLRRAKFDADTISQRIRTENENELQRHQLLREQTKRFTAQLVEMYTQQLDLVKAVPAMTIDNPNTAREDEMASAAMEIERSVRTYVEQEKAAGRKAAPPAGDEPQSAQPVGPPPPAESAAPTLPDVQPLPEPPSAESAAGTQDRPPDLKLPVFEIKFAGAQEEPEDASAEDDTVIPRPRFEFPDIQTQFGQQYSGHGETKQGGKRKE